MRDDPSTTILTQFWVHSRAWEYHKKKCADMDSGPWLARFWMKNLRSAQNSSTINYRTQYETPTDEPITGPLILRSADK